jgi:hypothetical protein
LRNLIHACLSDVAATGAAAAARLVRHAIDGCAAIAFIATWQCYAMSMALSSRPRDFLTHDM